MDENDNDDDFDDDFRLCDVDDGFGCRADDDDDFDDFDDDDGGDADDVHDDGNGY